MRSFLIAALVLAACTTLRWPPSGPWPPAPADLPEPLHYDNAGVIHLLVPMGRYPKKDAPSEPTRWVVDNLPDEFVEDLTDAADRAGCDDMAFKDAPCVFRLGDCVTVSLRPDTEPKLTISTGDCKVERVDPRGKALRESQPEPTQ